MKSSGFEVKSHKKAVTFCEVPQKGSKNPVKYHKKAVYYHVFIFGGNYDIIPRRTGRWWNGAVITDQGGK